MIRLIRTMTITAALFPAPRPGVKVRGPRWGEQPGPFSWPVLPLNCGPQLLPRGAGRENFQHPDDPNDPDDFGDPAGGDARSEHAAHQEHADHEDHGTPQNREDHADHEDRGAHYDHGDRDASQWIAMDHDGPRWIAMDRAGS